MKDVATDTDDLVSCLRKDVGTQTDFDPNIILTTKHQISVLEKICAHLLKYPATNLMILM